MPVTYEPIATQTLSGTSSQITFSSIPGTYTDLRLVASFQDSGEASYIRFNTDSGANYSRQLLYGAGSSATGLKQYNLTNIPFGGVPADYNANFLDIMNYSNTSVFKTSLFRNNEKSSFISYHCILWSSTAAITRIDIYATSANSLKAGSSFTLYGIKAA